MPHSHGLRGRWRSRAPPHPSAPTPVFCPLPDDLLRRGPLSRLSSRSGAEGRLPGWAHGFLPSPGLRPHFLPRPWAFLGRAGTRGDFQAVTGWESGLGRASGAFVAAPDPPLRLVPGVSPPRPSLPNLVTWLSLLPSRFYRRGTGFGEVGILAQGHAATNRQCPCGSHLGLTAEPGSRRHSPSLGLASSKPSARWASGWPSCAVSGHPQPAR